MLKTTTPMEAMILVSGKSIIPIGALETAQEERHAILTQISVVPYKCGHGVIVPGQIGVLVVVADVATLVKKFLN